MIISFIGGRENEEPRERENQTCAEPGEKTRPAQFTDKRSISNEEPGEKTTALRRENHGPRRENHGPAQFTDTRITGISVYSSLFFVCLDYEVSFDFFVSNQDCTHCSLFGLRYYRCFMFKNYLEI